MDRSQRDAIVRRDGNTCRGCSKRTRGQIHHILRQGQGGSDSPRNLVTLCGRCHMLVSPIPVARLLAYFGIDEAELLLSKARVEVAIHTWVMESSPGPTPAPQPTRLQAILLSLCRTMKGRSGSAQGEGEAPAEPDAGCVRGVGQANRTRLPARQEPRPPVPNKPRRVSV